MINFMLYVLQYNKYVDKKAYWRVVLLKNGVKKNCDLESRRTQVKFSVFLISPYMLLEQT